MRYWQIDFARGIAVILMLFFHLFFDASYFQKIELSGAFWFVFPRFIGGMFIFISGFTLSYTHRDRTLFSVSKLRRIAKFAVIAIAITIATMMFAPDEFVVFGIIHFFAVASLLAMFFVKKEKVCLFLGVCLTILGFYIQQFRFPFWHLFWLGLIPEGFRTLDYYPLLPWFGVMLLGMYFGKKIRLRAVNYKENFVSFLGRHSLAIYLIQHPVIVLLLHLYYRDVLQSILKV
ncbi:MAG: heparan-alpha-glucosaminide N-acetyltransferase [Archaeoglobaceae archaeon]